MTEILPGYESQADSPCGDVTFDLSDDKPVTCGLPAHHKGPHEDVWEGWRWS